MTYCCTGHLSRFGHRKKTSVTTHSSKVSEELWSRADGSEGLQLTYSPLDVVWPQISPDGKQAAFVGRDEQRIAAYIVDMRGGQPKPVTQSMPLTPSWSPDNKSLVITVLVPGQKSPWASDAVQLAILEVESGKVSVIPGSQSKGGARWATEQMIVAQGERNNLYSFDIRTQKWSELVDGPISAWAVSPDSQYVYFVRETPGNPLAMRVRLANHKIEVVTHSKASDVCPTRG